MTKISWYFAMHLYRFSIKLLFFLYCIFYGILIYAGDNKIAPWVGQSLDGKPCYYDGIEHVIVARLDYTKSEHRKNGLGVVEAYHFTREVQMLQRGKSGSIAGDLHYTLSAFPNHIKALNAIMHYEMILKTRVSLNDTPLEAPVECYFQRAIHFSPKDAASHALYAVYLKNKNRFDETDKLYKRAIELAPDQMVIRHSYGVFLAKQKKYDAALEQALVIYKNKFPQQKLKQMLTDAGVWK